MIKELFYKMTIPQIFSALSGTMCMLVDSIIVGRILGVDCMSAYGLAMPLLILLLAIGTMVCCGVQVVCAKALGFGDLKEASACYSTSIVIALVMAAAAMLLIFTACTPICKLLGSWENESGNAVFAYTGAFLKGYFLGAPFFFLGQITAPYLQAMGKRKTLLYSVLVMTAADIVFDLLSQYVFHAGMFGIGLASGLSYLASLLVCVGFFLKKDCPFRMSPDGIRPGMALKIFHAGSPVILTQIFYVLRVCISNHILLGLAGTQAVAAFSAVSTLANIPYSVGLGAGNTAILLSSLFYGERDRTSEKELMRSMIPFSFRMIVGVVAVMELVSPWAVLLYFKAGTSVYGIALSGFRLFMPEMIPCCINTVMKNYFQGIRKMWVTNLIAFLESFTLVVFAWILGRIFGLTGFWLGAACGQTATLAVISVIVWRKYGRMSFSADAYCFLEPEFGADPGDYRVYNVTSRKGAAADSIEDGMSCENKVIGISKNSVDFCRQKGLEEDLCMMIGLSIEEIGMNVIQHGFADDRRAYYLDMRVIVENDRCVLRFRDNCVSFDPTKYLELHQDQDPVAHLGIRMIMKSVREAYYVNSFGLNNVTLVI